MEKPTLVGTSSIPSISLAPDALGTPGAPVILHVVPQFLDRRVSDDQVLQDTSFRPFVVSARLSKAPLTGGDIKSGFSSADGDGYLIIPPSVAKLRIDVPGASFHIEKNGIGEISFVEFKCAASNPVDARVKFIDTVYPALDHLAYIHNVAIFVAMISVFDVTHQSRHIELIAPFRAQALSNSMSVLQNEMKPIYAMYREAKNANSDFYRFLCCYKIMEGLFGKMRAELFTRAKAVGVELVRHQDIVPDDPNLVPEHKPYAGKSMKDFFDTVLAGKYRNAVAHFKTDDGVLHVGAPTDIYLYSGLAFVTDLCARSLIKSHEELLTQLTY